MRKLLFALYMLICTTAVVAWDVCSDELGHWKLNDSDFTTTVDDFTGNAIDGTLEGELYTRNVSLPSGRINAAFDFDGVNDRVQFGDVLDLDGYSTYSIAVWVKTTHGGTVLSKWGTSGAYSYVLYISASTGKPTFATSADGTTVTAVTGSASIANGAWTHVVVTVGTGAAVMYVNNVSAGTATVGQPADTAAFLYLGRTTDQAGYFRGQMDDVRILSTSLDATERAAIYNSGSGDEDCDTTGTAPTPSDPSSANYVTGPTLSTDNAVARWNGTGGNVLQNSAVLIDDSNNVTVPGQLTLGTGATSYTFPATDGTATYIVTTDGNGTLTWIARFADMTKAVYDTDGDGLTDIAELLADGTNTATAAQVNAAIALSHTRLHDFAGVLDHTGLGSATNGNLMLTTAAGLPTTSSIASADVSSAISDSHAQLHALSNASNHTGISGSANDFVTLTATGLLQSSSGNLSTMYSSGLTSGGLLTEATTITLTVGAGSCWLRSTATSTAAIAAYDFVTSTVSVPANTTRYIGVEYNAGTPRVAVRTTDNWNHYTDFALGEAVNDGVDLHIEAAPVFTTNGIGHIIWRFHETEHARRDATGGGLVLSETGTRGLAITAGAFWQRLTRHTITSKDTSVSGDFDLYYHVGGVWTEDSYTSWPNLWYDDGNSTVTMTNNRYANLYVWVTSEDGFYAYLGSSDYVSLAGAQNEIMPVPPPSLAQLGLFVGRLTFQKSASSGAVVSAFDEILQGAAASDHGNLTGLSDNDHTQYLLSASLSLDLATDGGTTTTNPIEVGDVYTSQIWFETPDVTIYVSGSVLYFQDATTGPLALATLGSGGGGAGSGDVVGPAGATDNAFARFDTATGKLLQDGVVLGSDTGEVTGVTSLTLANLAVSGAIYANSDWDTYIKSTAGNVWNFFAGGFSGMQLTDAGITLNTSSKDRDFSIEGITPVTAAEYNAGDHTWTFTGTTVTLATTVSLSAIQYTTPSVSIDFRGEAIEWIAGEALDFGEACYIKSDGKIWRADASSSTTMPAVWVAVDVAASAGDKVRLARNGIVVNSSWSFTPGQRLFVSETSGAITATSPSGSGKTSQQIAVALADDTIALIFKNEFEEQ